MQTSHFQLLLPSLSVAVSIKIFILHKQSYAKTKNQKHHCRHFKHEQNNVFFLCLKLGNGGVMLATVFTKKLQWGQISR